MRCLWVMFGVLLCAAAKASAKPPVDLGKMSLHATVGQLSEPYLPPSANDTVASGNARVAIEHFRPYMTTGLGYIPPFDPFERPDQLVLKIDRSDFEAELAMSQITTTGGKNFTLKGLQIYLNTNRVDFTVNLPELVAHMLMKITIKTADATIDYTGSFNATMSNLLVEGMVTMEVRNMISKKVFHPVGMQLKVDADNVQYSLHNLLQRSRRSVAASEVTKMVFNDIQDDLAKAIVAAVMKDVDKLASNYSIEQVMQLILPSV